MQRELQCEVTVGQRHKKCEAIQERKWYILEIVEIISSIIRLFDFKDLYVISHFNMFENDVQEEFKSVYLV